MGEKGLEPMEKLPPGYHINAGHPGVAQPDGRPGPPLQWSTTHQAWTPPGFTTDPGDPDRIFNQATGGNGVWDDKSGKWIDAKTGQPISYEQ